MGLFQKLKLQMPRPMQTSIQLESVCDLLVRANAAKGATGFDWVNVSCLDVGSILIFALPAEAPVPRDGYGWMDDEKKNTITLNGREVETFERSLGFRGGSWLRFYGA